mgnify:FL=1
MQLGAFTIATNCKLLASRENELMYGIEEAEH